MVNTRVKDPTHRSLNRKLDRQKKALMRQNMRSLAARFDDDVASRAAVHKLKIEVLKDEREKLVRSKTRKDNPTVHK